MAHPSTTTPVYNVPMALSGSSHRTLGLEPDRAMARNLQHLSATRQCILGPMPVQLFLDSFLHVPSTADRSGPPQSGAFTSLPYHAGNAAGIIKPLLAALNGKSSPQPCCPGYTFHNTATRSLHPRRLGYMKPDICCFTTTHADIIQKCATASRAEFGYLELFFKIEADPMYDICSDPSPGTDPETRKSHHLMQDYGSDDEGGPSVVVQRAEKVFAQHIAFAGEVFARQHRVFLFTVSIFGYLARILRWDRSGCILTESFDIREQPEHLCEFLWRFSQTAHAGRGHDMTVEVAHADEEALFRTLISTEVRLQLDVDGEELDQALRYHYEPGRVTAIHVLQSNPEGDETSRRFIVSRPVISSLSLTGRGTRGFWAVDTTDHSVVFLKDTWRSHSTTGKEGDVLHRLNAANVQNVPTALTHGDVLYDAEDEDIGPSRRGLQKTLTDTFVSEPWKCQAYRGVDTQVAGRKHYRLVVSPVGYDLRYFRSTEELLHATYDVFIVMKDALARNCRLHRDISIANILLVKERGSDIRRGYLIDWECSWNVDESGQALQPGRAGTWDFMSIKMLRDSKNIRRYTIQDDMESLLYVVFYSALHWLPHNFTDEDGLPEVISAFFKRRTSKSGLLFGGDAKLRNTMDRFYTSAPTFDSTAFREWLDTAFDYHSPPKGKEVEYADKWSNPDHLDAFWSDFLHTHNLERGDRVTHEISPDYVPGDSSSSDDSDVSSSAASSVSDRERHDFPQHVHEPSAHPEGRDTSLQPQPGTGLRERVSPERLADVTPEPERVRASPRKRPRQSSEDAPSPRRSERIRGRQEREAVARTNAPANVPRAKGRRRATSAPRASASLGRSRQGGGPSAPRARGGSGGSARGRGRGDGRGSVRGARTTPSRK
ncbi:hypothetical protein L226DRAFT_90085 [Lentinus tigrinus ALCF2SS1-7]|uniref:Fungal-type protein kinase domain-containing protein n=1 Tax=Lentinus tigrinus ALCF2SS1-6 TaxID=1328759 RepID=A0A5C2RVW9_9APHY|nr:hypothetical protein L227DRAFT_639699 [Lentinus tigrinus ALCF2SS1-6]RPD73881.1 hypothetical protein L226DRAFT_90085 [Lentinus tigrinus ALCF2SS1-7]